MLLSESLRPRPAGSFDWQSADREFEDKTIRTLKPAARHTAALLLLSGCLASGSQAATILSDNLSATSAGSDTASGSTLLAAGFSTDSSTYTLESATLLLEEDTTGTATLALYSDDGGIPGSLLGTLTSPSSYSSSLTEETFTSTGITLSADTAYWLVLTADSGSFDWSWTDSNTGSGVGFTGDTAYYDGSYWYSSTGVYPYQLSVTADASAAPEPNAFSLFAAGSAALMVLLFRTRFRRKQLDNKPNQ